MKKFLLEISLEFETEVTCGEAKNSETIIERAKSRLREMYRPKHTKPEEGDFTDRFKFLILKEIKDK